MRRIARARVIRAVPILPVADMRDASDFYRALGFYVQAFDNGYAWVRHGTEEVAHLRLVPDLEPSANPASCYVFVDSVDAWHARWAQAGAPVEAVVDQPWGMREFAAIDPSGNRIRVGENL